MVLINKKYILIAIILFILGVLVMNFINNQRPPTQNKQIQNDKLVSSDKLPSGEQPDLNSKIEQVKKKGYTPYDTATYDPKYPLNVLIGIATGSADGYNQKAFFFYGDQYLGMDTTDPSSNITLAGKDDKTITLKYTLYNSSDVLANPTGGFATVRYQWDGTKITPLDPIPSTDWMVNGHR